MSLTLSDGGPLTFWAGSAKIDSWQLVDDDGNSLLAAGDVLQIVFRPAQGGSALLTLSTATGEITNIDTATGDFDYAISDGQVGTVRTGLGLTPQQRGCCSLAVVRIRGGLTQTMGAAVATLQPQA